MLLFASLVACGKSLDEKRQEEANRIAADRTLSDGEAVGRAARACVPLRARDVLVTRDKDGHRTVGVFPEELGLTHASSIESLKAQFRRNLSRAALCVFRAGADRGVRTVLLQQSLPVGGGKRQTVYVAKLTFERLAAVEGWQEVSDKITQAVEQQLVILKEDFDGLEVR